MHQRPKEHEVGEDEQDRSNDQVLNAKSLGSGEGEKGRQTDRVNEEYDDRMTLGHQLYY